MIMQSISGLAQAAGEIITRSDHMPTQNERYGHWAQKFYGGGYHEAFKDGDFPVTHTLALEVPMQRRH